MNANGRLTEKDKIDIISLVKVYGHQWKRIAAQVGRNWETVRSFYSSYEKHQTINPKLGRPVSITEELKDGVVGFMDSEPTNNLRDVAYNFSLSTTSVRGILNDNSIHYHKPIPTVPLLPTHKMNRIAFCTNYLNNMCPNVIFTDESTIQIQLGVGGIWRRRGLYPPGSFAEKDPHPISVMVWGGIGPRGDRTKLLRFDGSVTSDSYCREIIGNQIIQNIQGVFGQQWTWQQDNARPHTAINTRRVLLSLMPNVMPWPAKSPDLSPIEQIWAYIKKRLEGQKFTDRNQLWNSILFEWNSIPDQIIHNIYQSFWARCLVCVQQNGECLNGHWTDVKHTHNMYRTKLYYYTDPQTNIQYVYDL